MNTCDLTQQVVVLVSAVRPDGYHFFFVIASLVSVAAKASAGLWLCARLHPILHLDHMQDKR